MRRYHRPIDPADGAVSYVTPGYSAVSTGEFRKRASARVTLCDATSAPSGDYSLEKISQVSRAL